MPAASALFVKAAWTWFLAGLALGGILAAHKALGWWPDLAPRLWSTHVHVMLVGFVAQWIMGIAFWFYPRPEGGSAPRHRRALAAWALLNGGILVRALAEARLADAPPARWAYLGAVASQALGGGLYVTAVWGRVYCSLRLPEGRVRETCLLSAARKVWTGQEVE